ncbi:MAG TPA: glutamine--fructose-6-phosphate transaminase (isomerizing) [Nitrospirota bacterium]
MCGIVGYVGGRNAVPILIEGLKKLEYRGYDSAGIAFFQDGAISVKRSVGKIRELECMMKGGCFNASLGIGHTRWATHGRPSEENAHPHRWGGTVVVHNGIIENHAELKQRLEAAGHVFSSETDTEVIAHLVEEQVELGLPLESAVREALAGLRGAYAVGIVNEFSPDKLIAARFGCPLVVGMGAEEFFVASDLPAILDHTSEVVFLDDGEMAMISSGGVAFSGLDGSIREKAATHIDWSPAMAEKGGYRHFMLKEIFEQPQAITDTFRGRISEIAGTVHLSEMKMTDDELRQVKKVMLVACGTSWHACLIGKLMIEELARIPAEVDIASEFRYRNPIMDGGTLLVSVTQSGETADTLAAMREARRLGARSVAICNVVGSTASREADGVVYTHAGPEIGVASTKAFTSQLTAFFLLALYLGRVRGVLGDDAVRGYLDELVRIPAKVERLLSEMIEPVEKLSSLYFKKPDFLFLGRGYNYPVALEGALKLKEISYIHAEGYPAGEMKHGPIALIDENMPVVIIAAKDGVYEKVASNLEEVRSRGGKVIAVVSEDDAEVASKADHVLRVPETIPGLTPILMTIPLQLLAYQISVLRGNDVDQPRNLAKSVTVE